MSDFNEHTQRGTSMSTLILIAVAVLGLMYFLAKGCTNSSEVQASPSHHSAMIHNAEPLSL